MLETLLLAAALSADPVPPPAPVTAPAAVPARPPAAASSAAGQGTCPLPVYMKKGKVRCADKPATTAFGRVTWIEGGRTVTVSAAQVDLDRTMPVHRKAARRGGFSMAGDMTRPVEPLLAPGQPAREPGLTVGATTVQYPGTEEPPPPPLTPGERDALQADLRKARSELDILKKRARALALIGAGPSNALGGAIHQREREIESIQRRLAAGR